MRRRQRAHQRFQRGFHLGAGNRLAIAHAALLAAHVIGIFAAFALGPRCCHRVVAIAAGDKAAQRKIGIDVLARRRTGLARQPILDQVKGFQRDQALMLGLLQGQLPAWNLKIARIKRLGQYLMHALIQNQAVPASREGRRRFKKPLHLRL
nr:hypothetical protein [uncultured Novosphingobium sp.]